jgi:hypothetical protein
MVDCYFYNMPHSLSHLLLLPLSYAVDNIHHSTLDTKLTLLYTYYASLPLSHRSPPTLFSRTPQAMVDELRAQGTELMLSPYIHSVEGTSKNFAAARDQGI